MRDLTMRFYLGAMMIATALLFTGCSEEEQLLLQGAVGDEVGDVSAAGGTGSGTSSEEATDSNPSVAKQKLRDFVRRFNGRLKSKHLDRWVEAVVALHAERDQLNLRKLTRRMVKRCIRYHKKRAKRLSLKGKIRKAKRHARIAKRIRKRRNRIVQVLHAEAVAVIQ